MILRRLTSAETKNISNNFDGLFNADNGWFYRDQRNQKIRYYNSPIIALTASALQETKDQCKQVGMDDYLPKPFDKDEIHKILAKWL